MEDKKITISLTTVITIAIIVAIILIGIIGYVIYNNTKNEIATNNNYYQGTNINEEIIKNDTTNDTNTTNSINTNIDTSNINNQEIEGKSSSKSSPLSIGKWGIASKYYSGEYIDIPTRVTKVTRGNIAAQEVEKYCNSGSSIYKYTEAKENMEWAIIDYEVDLTSLKNDTSIKLDSKVTGTGDNTSIKYNGVTYITSTMNMTSGYANSGIVTAKFAVQLPIGCTDYLIALGSSSSTQAFFIGQ